MFLFLRIFRVDVVHGVFFLPAADVCAGCVLGAVVFGLFVCHCTYFRKMLAVVFLLMLFWVPCCLISSVSVDFLLPCFDFRRCRSFLFSTLVVIVVASRRR